MSGFWKKFDDLMDALPGYIDDQLDDNSVTQTSMGSTCTTTIVQGGKKVVVKTTLKKTTITVNGKEYVEKT